MLEQYLADLARLRDDPDSLPCQVRVVSALDRESGSRWERWLEYLAIFRNPVAAAVNAGTDHRRLYVHIWSSGSPAQVERSACSFPIDVAPGNVPFETVASAEVVGHIAPGRGIGVRLSGDLLMPVGPLRPLVRGARLPSRAS